MQPARDHTQRQLNGVRFSVGQSLRKQSDLAGLRRRDLPVETMFAFLRDRYCLLCGAEQLRPRNGDRDPS